MNEYNEAVDPVLPVTEDAPRIQPELDADGNVIVQTAPFDVEAEEVAVD